jgi:hypothetical protein
VRNAVSAALRMASVVIGMLTIAKGAIIVTGGLSLLSLAPHFFGHWKSIKHFVAGQQRNWGKQGLFIRFLCQRKRCLVEYIQLPE